MERNFAVDALLDVKRLIPGSYAEIDLVLMNPIVQHRSRDILRATLRLLGCSTLFYALPPGPFSPQVLPILYQVAHCYRLISFHHKCCPSCIR
jgi:hypothetical protein